MAEMTICDILENTTGVSGFGGQLTEDTILDFCPDKTMVVETTLTEIGRERVLSGRGLERGKFYFLIRGFGWVTAFTQISESCMG